MTFTTMDVECNALGHLLRCGDVLCLRCGRMIDPSNPFPFADAIANPDDDDKTEPRSAND